jgi:hypothetical protein
LLTVKTNISKIELVLLYCWINKLATCYIILIWNSKLYLFINSYKKQNSIKYNKIIKQQVNNKFIKYNY